jgi:alpha-1,3-rhamnosyltransferase
MTTTSAKTNNGQLTADSISVLIPSYNHARFVQSTLRSIFRQTLAPANLLVIDDGSTDDSPRIIDATLKDCPFPCELIARENRGLSATLNQGLAQTTGEYFAYLGSDDVWLPEFLKARIKLLESRADAVLAYGHAYFIDEQDRIIDCTSDWADYADGDPKSMLLKTIAPMSPTVVYRREPLTKHRWNEEARLEDYDLYLRLSAEGEFAFDPRVLSAWRRHDTNTSWNQTMMLDEQLKAQREAARRFGLTNSEIQRLQTVTQFARAEDFLRVGEKSRALNLMLANLRGARSPLNTARILLRLLTPNSLLRRRVRNQQQRAFERYGTMRI